MLDEKAAGRAGAGGTLREVILGGALFGVLEALPALPLALAHSPQP